MRFECIITGCALRLQGSDDYAWGDLHKFGDTYTFVANTDHSGSTVWRTTLDGSLTDTHKVLTIPMGHEYFERRGIFVIPNGWLCLNFAASSYVLRWSNQP